MSIYANEQSVGLTRIDEQRSKAIQVIYGVIVNWHEIWIEISSPNAPNFSSDDEFIQYYYKLAKNWINVADEISKQVLNYAIYFSNESYEKISYFGIAAMNKSYDFYNSTFGKLDMQNSAHKLSLFSLIEAERKILPQGIQAQLTGLKNDLIIEFRRLLKAGPELPFPSGENKQ